MLRRKPNTAEPTTPPLHPPPLARSTTVVRQRRHTDTVGFIRDLPEDLMKAFRATLEEMEDADLIIHLVDVSSPYFKERMETVEKIFHDIGIGGIPRLLVFNKIDLVEKRTLYALLHRYRAIGISAKDRATFRPLLKRLETRLWPMEGMVYAPNKEETEEIS